MDTRHKVWSVALSLIVVGATLAGLSVLLGAGTVEGGLVVAESGIVAAFFAGVILALSSTVAKGIDARARMASEYSDSELLRLRQDR